MLKIIIANIAGLTSFILTALLSVMVTVLMKKKKQRMWITVVGVLSLALILFIGSKVAQVSIGADFQMNIEGVWVESYTRWVKNDGSSDYLKAGKTYYAICCIRYDLIRRQLNFDGNAFRSDGVRVGQWKSNKVLAVPEDYKIYYFYDGERIKPTQIKDGGPSVMGYGIITFNQFLKSGQGTFQELNSTSPPYYLEINRVTETMCKELIKKEKLQSHDDYMQFIIKYSQMKTQQSKKSDSKAEGIVKTNRK